MAYMIVTRIAILFIIMASLHIASYHTDALAKPGKFVATLAHNLDAAGNLPPTTFDSGKVKVKFTDAPDSVKIEIKGISAPD